ncbi:MAG: hypothetical protein NTX25_09650, partial [Proteobacteria bacterium]|nr:hypothetical protein [Pseudomonadota bacterium]
LSKYLGSPYMPADLESLMGAFSEIIGHSSQESATPNAVNSLLWQIAMEGQAKDLAEMVCLPSSISLLQAEFYNPAHNLCSDPVNLLSAGQDLEDLWLAIARYDAPEAEMRAWIADEQAEDGILASASSGKERVSQLLQSIFLNPYFLLEH